MCFDQGGRLLQSPRTAYGATPSELCETREWVNPERGAVMPGFGHRGNSGGRGGQGMQEAEMSTRGPLRICPTRKCLEMDLRGGEIGRRMCALEL